VRRTTGFAVGQLVGDEEASFASDVHALEAGVPAWDDAVGTGGKGDGFAAGMVVGGVELGAVGEPAGVADGVPLDLGVGHRGPQNTGLGQRAGTDFSVDVLEGIDGFGDADDLRDVRRSGGC